MSVKEKRLVESVLFSASKPISINEIKETTCLSPDKIKKTLEELIEDYNLIGWSQDINGNGVLNFVPNGTNPPFYPSLGLSTTPSITTDDFERITVVWSSLTETYDNGVNNYRHLWARLSPNNGEFWGNFVDLTSDLIHIFDECVFPNSASLVMITFI